MGRKFGAHIVPGSRNGYGSFCDAKPAVVLAVDEGGALLEAKQKSGGQTATIFRQTSVYIEAPPGFNDTSDMIALARQWYPLVKAKWQQNPADYYTVTNEISGNDSVVMRRLVEYEREFVRLANLDGFKVVVLNLAGGSPGDFNLWKEIFAPFIVEAWQAGNAYGRHAYGSGDLVANGQVVPGNPSRPFEEINHLNSLGHRGKMFITECGLDAGFGFAGIERFVSQMVAYESHLQMKSDIVGMCMWTMGNWSEANWQDAIPAIVPHMLVPVVDPPPIEPPPPTGDLNVQLWNASNSVPHLNLNESLGLWKQIDADGYLPLHTEVALTVDGTPYAVQQAKKSNVANRLYVWTPNKPLYYIVQGEQEPPVEPPPLPHVDRPLGIDVSRWQGTMNWAKAKSEGVWYAFIKATEHTAWIDPKFNQNWHGAKQAGLLVGAYHFFRGNIDPVAQANHFVNTVLANGGNADLPFVLDVEIAPTLANLALSKRLREVDGYMGQTIGLGDEKARFGQSRTLTAGNFANDVRICLDRIAQLTGHKPLLYTGIAFWNTYLRSVPTSTCELWIANWTTRPDPYLPKDWTTWAFWQYTSDANGFRYGAQSARLDMNRYNGTLAALYEYAGYSQPPPIEPPPPPQGDKIDLLPYFVTSDSFGPLYEVQTRGAGQQRHQTQVEGNRFWHTKDGEWEELYCDSGFIYRSTDTSMGNGLFYKLTDADDLIRSKWARRYMALGEVFERKPKITVARKSDCAVQSVDDATNYLRLTAIIPTKSFFTGIILNGVIQMDWMNDPNGSVVESYYYAKNYGLVGWASSDGREAAISEIHAPGSRPNNTRESGCFS